MGEQDHALSLIRDELLGDINTEIDCVIEKINSYEKLRLLGGIGSFVDGGVQYRRPTLPNILETTVEYALSIASSFENDYTAPIPSAEDLAHIHGDLEKIRTKYLEFALGEKNSNQYSPLEQMLRGKVIQNTLTIRGEGYRLHVDEVFLELFGSHQQVFEKKFGFDPEAILSVIEYLEGELVANRINRDQEYREFIEWMKSQDMGQLVMKYSSLPQDPFMFSQIYQLETRKVPRFKSVEDAFKFDVDDLKETEIRVIAALATEFGDNVNFLNPKFRAHPLNDTIITSKPILYSPERKSYYCFSTRILHRSMFSIGEELIKIANEAYFQNVYLGKGVNGRSTYFEEKVASLFCKIMPRRTAHSNLKYKVGKQEFEIDVLLETDKYIILAEVKSGIYSNAAKRGAIRNLKADVKDFVGYGVDQLTRTENHINSQPNHFFYHKDGRTVVVSPNKTILKFVVPFASIIGITNQLHELAQVGILGLHKVLPLSISVFDLMVIADVFENDEVGFIGYVLARLALYDEPEFKIEGELDFLGLYLSRDYQKMIKVFKREKTVTVDSKFRSSLDNYYAAVSRGQPWKKPRKVG